MAQTNKKIVPRNVNFADWYTSVINEANLIQYTDVKGAMMFKPNAWAIWENIQKILDIEFKQNYVSNVSMPCLIPLEDFEKEKEHVEGFAPELFTVCQIGNKNLEKKLCLRPTSEIWFSKYFANEVKSYKDLPIKVNQWCSVFRAEKNTRPFLRNSEFHWHELHACFADSDSAILFAQKILNVYSNLCEKYLAIPVIKGEKTANERFAGGVISYTIEAMMQDGQALQSGTSHYLGQNFAKAYEITYQNVNNQLTHVHSTSHGLTTRIIGALIMTHSDDDGLVLPFPVAFIQINIIKLWPDNEPQLHTYAQQIYDKLSKKYRCRMVDNTSKSLGYLLSESETNGIPINIIIGNQDLSENCFTYNTRICKDKQKMHIDDMDEKIPEIISNYQSTLYNNALNRLNSNIIDVKNIDEFKHVISNNQWARCYFDGNENDEITIKQLTTATARCIIEEHSQIEEKCFYTQRPCRRIVIFAKAY